MKKVKAIHCQFSCPASRAVALRKCGFHSRRCRGHHRCQVEFVELPEEFRCL